MFVTIENRAGQALLDTQVAIKAAGGTPFTTTLRRLESGEKRELPVGEFVNANGLPFNPRSARPREVTVAAKDLVGKDYEVSVPWTR